MTWGGPGFIVAIILVMTMGWIFNNWIRARHGYPLEDEWGGKTHREDPAAGQLREENERLKLRLEASEDRLAVLERIVTDRGFQVAGEIEALRETPMAALGNRSER